MVSDSAKSFQENSEEQVISAGLIVFCSNLDLKMFYENESIKRSFEAHVQCKFIAGFLKLHAAKNSFEILVSRENS